jgi:hypothetical protein
VKGSHIADFLHFLLAFAKVAKNIDKSSASFNNIRNREIHHENLLKWLYSSWTRTFFDIPREADFENKKYGTHRINSVVELIAQKKSKLLGYKKTEWKFSPSVQKCGTN